MMMHALDVIHVLSLGLIDIVRLWFQCDIIIIIKYACPARPADTVTGSNRHHKAGSGAELIPSNYFTS